MSGGGGSTLRRPLPLAGHTLFHPKHGHFLIQFQMPHTLNPLAILIIFTLILLPRLALALRVINPKPSHAVAITLAGEKPSAVSMTAP